MKLIDVAIFNFPSQASVLESILAAEGIEFSLNNPISAAIVPSVGTRLSVKETDVKRVKELIKEAGFENSLIGEE